VQVKSCDIEFADDEGFVGDRASKGAVRRLIEECLRPDPPYNAFSFALTRLKVAKQYDTPLKAHTTPQKWGRKPQISHFFSRLLAHRFVLKPINNQFDRMNASLSGRTPFFVNHP
jgi:hypothetical protein